MFRDGRAVLHRGDCLAVLPTLPAESVDAVVTDPPYHLTTGKKGGSGLASENLASPAGRSRATTGFMGKAWDGGDIAHSPAIWREALRVAKPGAHLLAFGGTRTFHRLACAIEDAGWEIRDTMMWVYGSGFPKSLDVSKAIDKEAGVVRPRHRGVRSGVVGPTFAQDAWSKANKDSVLDGVPITAAAAWQGWGTALKPAWEPIIVARKPLEGTVAENVQRHGTGGLNIDGCRIAADPWSRPSLKQDIRGGKFHAASGVPLRDVGPQNGSSLGRWPANLIHDGGEEVVDLFPQTASGSGTIIQRAGGFARKLEGRTDRPEIIPDGEGYGDSGSAARFFYCAKATRAERNDGLEDLPLRPRKTQGIQVKTSIDRRDGKGRVPVNARIQPAQNTHPTVKPVALMRYLCRLVTPPGGLILDPFLGSGSTGKAAALEGFRFIGMEIDPAYTEIAAARIRAAVPPLFRGAAVNPQSAIHNPQSLSPRPSPPLARRTKDGGLAGPGEAGVSPLPARLRARVARGRRAVLPADDQALSRA